MWDETLRAWVARVDRALLDRDGAHYFGTGSQDAIGFWVCRGEGWPNPYAFGIYWAPDDRHTAGIDWERPQAPIRTTVGNDPLVIAFDDAPATELATAREVDPFVWKDD